MSDPNANQPPAPPAPPAVPQHLQGSVQSAPSPLDGMTPEQIAGLESFQRQINLVAANEKRDGARSIERQLVEELGMPLDQIKAAAKAHTDAETARMTEAQRKLAEVEERERKAEAREAAAQATIDDMTKVSALVSLGMSQDQAQAAKGMLTLPDGPVTVDGSKAAAENLKTLFPTLFPVETPADPNAPQPPAGQSPAAPAGQAPRPPDTHTRGTQSAGGGNGQSAAERAQARFNTRKGKTPAA